MAYTENIHKTQQMDTSKNKGKNLWVLAFFLYIIFIIFSNIKLSV